MDRLQLNTTKEKTGQCRAADAVVDAIEDRIARGELKDASPLPSERALMEEFGASRTVIREAITALSNRGLIDCRPRYRPVVKRLDYATVLNATSPVVRQLLNDPKGVRNLYNTRVFVERGLVRYAAEHASKNDIQRLKAALGANRESITDSILFYKTDTEFHRVIYTIVDNPVFPALHEGFVSWLAPQWDRMERSPERNEHNYLAHAAIFQAILERDPDTAEGALVAHLDAAWEFVRATFDWEQ